MLEKFLADLQSAERKVEITRDALKELPFSKGRTLRHKRVLQPNDVENALRTLSEPLALSYAQARADLESERITWVSVAHEIREVLRQMLDLLAPDERVQKQSWYKQQPDTKGPTQKQRALYILRKRNATSSEEDMIKKIDLVEELISTLVRDTYTRASVAAHGQKDRKEAQRLLKYFDAFAHDLLDL
jgi:hypothetical protein